MSQKTKFIFPECWKDDIRMNALYSPFRPKYINPEYYNKKMEFWHTLIFNFYKSNEGCPAFSKEDLENAFNRNNQIPLCIDTILEEMIRTNIIKEQSEFYSESNWSSWILRKLIKNPLKWGYNKIMPSNKQKTDLFIHYKLLQELSSDLSKILQKYSGEVFTLDELRKKVQSDIHLNEFGLKICLYYLSVQKIIYVDWEIQENEIIIILVKIPSKNNPSDKLTDNDRNVKKLKDTRKYLTEEIKHMELQMNECNDLARKHVRENKKNLAKINLRKKLFLQERIGKKGDILFNIETLICHIEDARQNGEILSLFQIGSETLHSINSKLNLEKVNEVLCTMEDVMSDHKEIQNEINFFGMKDANDTDLENELEELLSCENESTQSTLQKSKNECDPSNNDNMENLLDNLNNLKIDSFDPLVESLTQV